MFDKEIMRNLTMNERICNSKQTNVKRRWNDDGKSFLVCFGGQLEKKKKKVFMSSNRKLKL